MENISRRVFLRRGATGAAAVGAVAALPRLPQFVRSRRRGAVHASGLAAPEGQAGEDALVVHIPDARKGTLHLMFGTREIVSHDPALVARLVRAAR